MSNASCFIQFSQGTLLPQAPEKFTYPFCYQVDPLALLACQELQQQLPDFHPFNSIQQGRMYGVLVVRKFDGELGYLAALSGNSNDIKSAKTINFVPAVYQNEQLSSFQIEQQEEIQQLNNKIQQRQTCPTLLKYQAEHKSFTEQAELAISNKQQVLRENKKQRKQKRLWLTDANLTADEERQISIDLARASVTDKKELSALKNHWQLILNESASKLDKLATEISSLTKLRAKLSNKLQKYLFSQYQLLNNQGKIKDLNQIFQTSIQQKPPAGAGDCAAPKLLQYAFQHQLTPVCMAEFWWGNQPKSAIRKHLHFYPACQGKCQPILTHMLSGMAVDENPLLTNPGENTKLEIVYQDEHLVVVNKPANLLSVPGKNINDSVLSRIKKLFPQATGSLILHRLDMATSGLLLLALNERAHKHLQQQFINKAIKKRYIATISGQLSQKSGKVILPLRCDFDDRPRQMVCYQQGKYAETHWQVIEENKHATRLYLYPITGRTHQLRMHCAHPDGLNLPIVGDDLYGSSANRLHLHAQQLSFTHPISKQLLTFEVEPDF